MEELFLFDTEFGPVGIVWRAGGAVRRIIIHPERTGGAGCARVRGLAKMIAAFLRGQRVSFDLSLLSMDRCTAFSRRVLLAESRIPRGSVTTYGALARSIGRPGAARAVGRALSSNPFPIVIPCHRVVRSDGSLGGYQGGRRMKRALLRMEGVPFLDSGLLSRSCLVSGS